jgi:hypothetical protein
VATACGSGAELAEGEEASLDRVSLMDDAFVISKRVKCSR